MIQVCNDQENKDFSNICLQSYRQSYFNSFHFAIDSHMP